jgi:hypothetical protein
MVYGYLAVILKKVEADVVALLAATTQKEHHQGGVPIGTV